MTRRFADGLLPNDGCFVELGRNGCFRLRHKSAKQNVGNHVVEQAGAVYLHKVPIEVECREFRMENRERRLLNQDLIVCHVGKAESRVKSVEVAGNPGVHLSFYKKGSSKAAALRRFREKVKDWRSTGCQLQIPEAEEEWDDDAKTADVGLVLFRDTGDRATADAERFLRFMVGVPLSVSSLSCKLPSDSEYVIITLNRFNNLRQFWLEQNRTLHSLLWP
jgi:hypothetical protein